MKHAAAATLAMNGPSDAPATEAPRRDVVLEVSELRAGYGHVPVLHGVSLQVLEGEAIGIVGHNGMGKTTLLKALTGLLPASGGRISMDGVDVTRLPAHGRARMGIGYVPQGRGILPALSALENLRLAWRGDSGETEAQAVQRVVDTFPRLEALLDRRGGALSGGEQQILALARALVPDPWLLLLDEPSEGIQPSIVQEIGATLAKLRSEHGLAMLIVEQNLDLVLDVAERVVVLERGRIVREARVDGLLGGDFADMLGMGPTRGRGGHTSASAATASSQAYTPPAPTPPPAPPTPSRATPVAPSPARRTANTSVSRAAATRRRRARCTTRTATVMRRAARRRDRQHWWARARSRWRSAATKAARSACPPAGAACTA